MTCDLFKDKLLEYMDGSLDAETKDMLDSHISTCRQCGDLIEYESFFRKTLRSMPYEKPSHGFYQRIFEGLETKTGSGRGNWGFLTGFSTAVAAALAAWLFFSPMVDKGPSQDLFEQVNVSINQVSQIHFSFDSPAQFENVKLTIILPEQLEIQGFPGKKYISWYTSLKQGTNVLSLPVVAKGTKGGFIETRISNAKKTKTFRLQVNIENNTQAVKT